MKLIDEVQYMIFSEYFMQKFSPWGLVPHHQLLNSISRINLELHEVRQKLLSYPLPPHWWI